MVNLAMSIFVFLTKLLIFWHPWHPWVCIRSDLKPLFETDMRDSSYSAVLSTKPKNITLSITLENSEQLRPTLGSLLLYAVVRGFLWHTSNSLKRAQYETPFLFY